ncbi:hypothetical protein [Massilia soli]|uniref:Uncharacterized protein n=1 Tax=Massilia soli TaxID=2792854 RepID=A0ABS7SM53_9BURK|nr:hypothetical protein [Massilia soli]MBZ2207132.1 hypothetical protein [Massilia soli]
MTKLFNLNANPADFPDAMAKATRIGRMYAMERKRKISSVRAVSELVSPGCANGFATALKQACNAGHWSASL